LLYAERIAEGKDVDYPEIPKVEPWGFVKEREIS